MEQKVIPQDIRGLGNICDNFSEEDFTKVNADTFLQDDVIVNNVSLRCFRVQMKGTDITVSVSGSTSLRYNQSTTYNLTVKTVNGLPVSGVKVGLYVNNVLVVSSSNTGSAGGCTITYTPQVFGPVDLEFKVLPQGSYSMTKTTLRVSVDIETNIIVYSPYGSMNGTKIPIVGVWVVTEDRSTIINGSVLMTHNGTTQTLDTQSSSGSVQYYAFSNINYGDTLTFKYEGTGYYSDSTVTKVAGSDGLVTNSLPTDIPGGS